MAKTNPEIKFVEIDATANEIAEVPVEGYPTIYFFKRDKNDAVVKFVEDRTVEQLTKWVESLAESVSTESAEGELWSVMTLWIKF